LDLSARHLLSRKKPYYKAPYEDELDFRRSFFDTKAVDYGKIIKEIA